MPSKKKKYNARFPAGRIKKIMQTDEEVGKVAQAVPVIISRTLELFVESLLTKSMQITQARNAKTLTPSHMKQCILSESRFDFLKDLVKNIPDASTLEDNENSSNEVVHYTICKNVNDAELSEHSAEEVATNLYTEQSTSAARAPVIQYGHSKVPNLDAPKLNFAVSRLAKKLSEPKIHIDLSSIPNMTPPTQLPISQPLDEKSTASVSDEIPQLIPISHNNIYNNQSAGGDNLMIDEDYDN